MAEIVDVLLATRNGEGHVADQLESLIDQTYRDIQILVSDDSSTDHTLDIIKRYEKIDNRVHIVSERGSRGGAKGNFLHMLKYSCADYVMFCDQDDVWNADKIECSMAEMRTANPSLPVLVYSDMLVVDQNLHTISDSFVRYSRIPVENCSFNTVIAQNLGAGCTFLINKPLLDLARRECDIEELIMHDWWIALIASAFGEVRFIRRPLMLYRQHGDNAIGVSEYSILNRVCHVSSMTKRLELWILQALQFEKVFDDLLKQDQRNAISILRHIYESDFLNRLPYVVKNTVWKRGFAKRCGQLLAFMLL